MKVQHSAVVAHSVRLACLILMLVLMLIPSVSVYTVETEGENLSVVSFFVKPVSESSEEYKQNENAFVLNIPQLAVEMWELTEDYKDMGKEMDMISPPPVEKGEEAINPEEMAPEDAKFHEDMKFNRTFMVTAQFLCRIVSVLLLASFVFLCLEILAAVAHLLYTLHPSFVWIKKRHPVPAFLWAIGLAGAYVVCVLFQFCVLGARNATLKTLEATYRVQLVSTGMHLALLWIIAFAVYAILALVLRKLSAKKADEKANA